MKEIGLISIVIPIYNAEKYLSQCIRSIISQTYKNIEIICVNDGSSDNSVAILNFYKNIDERIKIISQKNSGVTAARERGVEESSAEWIVFSDADDTMPVQAIEFLAENAENYAIVIGHVEFQGSFKWPYQPMHTEWTKKQSLRRIITGKLHCGPVAKLFRKKLFDKIVFDMPDTFVLGEDKIMNMGLISNITSGQKILQIPNVVYTYIQRPTYHPSNIKTRYERMKFECKILSKSSETLVFLRMFLFLKECIKEILRKLIKS